MLIKKCFASSRARLAPCFYFSRTLSESAQKALWASKIVREILAASPQSNSSPSLREHLTTLQLNIQDYSLDSQVRNSVMKLFTTGIYLDQLVFNQVRIRQATQSPSGLFIFSPNYLVTKQMFQHLTTQEENLFIIGADGIGKTVSTILFIHLASMINQFRFQAFYDKSLTKTKELEQLKKLGLIEFLPKLYYWTADRKGYKFSIKQLVLSRSHELSSSHLKILKKLPLYRLPCSLKAYYRSAEIVTNVVIDQIDYIASKVRNWNNRIENEEDIDNKMEDQISEVVRKYQQSKFKTKESFRYILIKRDSLLNLKRGYLDECGAKRKRLLNFQNIPDVMKELHQFQQYGRYSIFNSSANIQQKLLWNQYISNKDIIKFKLFDDPEKSFSNERITFQQNLQKQWGKIDFLQFFWFQLYRTLQDQGVSQEKLSQLKLRFSEKAKQFNLKMYYRFLHIRKIVSRVINSAKISQKSSFDQINNFMELCINNFETFYKEEAMTKLTQFLNRGYEMERQFKQRFISILYFYAVHLAETDEKAQLNLYTLKELVGSELSAQQRLIYSKTHNKQLLPTKPLREIDQYEELRQVLFTDPSEDKMEKIVFSYSPLELSKILAHVAIPKFISWPFSFYSSFQRLLRKAKLGQVFEHLFLVLFRSTNTKVSFSTNAGEMVLEIEHSTKFIPFEKRDTQENPNSFEDHFGNIIQLGSIMPGKYFAATTANFNKDAIQQDSASIDLLIGMYSEGKFIINSFDVTISGNVDVIKAKKAKALELFQNIFKQSESNEKFDINHIIFCPRAMCLKDQSSESPMINILFSPIQGFKILQSQASMHERLLFQRIRLSLERVNLIQRT